MDAMIPWSAGIAMILPFYPSGKRGRPVKGIETMLRMYLMQIWFNLSDAAIEDAIYDSYAMRSFMRIDFNEEQVPAWLSRSISAMSKSPIAVSRKTSTALISVSLIQHLVTSGEIMNTDSKISLSNMAMHMI